MGIFILAGFLLVAFAAYRVYLYKKQRQIEEMASDAQAYVSSEIVELLQIVKSLVIKNEGQVSPDLQVIQDQIRNQTENLMCHTDSEESVRDYLVHAKQDIALLKVKLDKISKGETLDLNPTQSTTQHIPTEIEHEFDALK